MKICILMSDLSWNGGTAKTASSLSNALLEKHEVYFLTLHQEYDAILFPLEDSVRQIILKPANGKLGILSQIFEIHHVVKENDIDCVINVDVGMSLYGIPAAWGTKAKVITWEHANYYNNWGSRMFPYVRRFAAHRSDAMVVLTEQDKLNYETHIPSKVPVYAIANPVQPHDVHYDISSRTILSAGALLSIKGYDRAIDVAKRIMPGHPDWKWVICGEGPEREALEHLIREAGLENQVLLPGTVRDMESQYRSAAMVVMTSQMEGLPMVLLEAKSYGLPLVSFDIMTGPRDIIEDGVNGYLVEPYDVKTMAQKLEQLMDNDHLRCEMSAQAKCGIERFSEKRVLEEWKQLLEA